GWHHDAHRLSSTSLPSKSARATQLPERSWKQTSGAGSGGEAAINSPGLRSGSTARAAPTASRSATATVPKEANRRPDPPGSDPGKRDPAGPGAAGPNALWGGRFAEGPAAIMRRINASIGVDKRLYAEDIAGSQAPCVMPGFTHLQIAQPVTFGHHLMAYVEMLGRDRGRFADCRRRLNESPLGAAALAGTAFPIDRDRTAAALGFDRPSANSIDAVSDR